MPQQLIQRPGINPETGVAYEPSDLMTTINPETEKLFSGLQEASDVGGYSPVSDPGTLPPINETADIASGAGTPPPPPAGTGGDMSGLTDTDGDGVPDITTSDEAQANINELTEDLDNLDIENEEDKALLQEEYKQAESDINRMYDEREAELRERFTGERGTESAVAFRLGQAGTPYEVAQKKEYEDKRMKILTLLQREKDSKIAQAKLALKQGNRQLARDLKTDIKSLRDQQRQIRQNDWNRQMAEFNASLAWGREERAEEQWEMTKEEYEAEQAMSNFTQMAESGTDIASISDEDKADIEKKTGMVKGTFDDIYKSIQAVQLAEAEADDIKTQKSLIDLLSKVPTNMQVPIGDALYQGLKEVDANLWHYDKTVGNQKTRIYIDKNTGEEAYRKELGQAYKYTGTTKTEKIKPEEAMTAQLSTIVGKDGYISPDDYLIARNAWIEEGLSPTVFDTKFKGFRNPNNPYYITEKTKKTNSDRTL